MRARLLLALALGAVWSVPVRADVIQSCDLSKGAADYVDRGLYVTHFGGCTLDSLVLRYQTSGGPDTYMVQVTAHLGRFGGAVLDSAQVSFDASGGPRTLVFHGRTVPRDSLVAFVQTRLDAAPGAVYFDTGTCDIGDSCDACPGIVETEDTSPPLSTFRRGSVWLILHGRTSVPVPDPLTAQVQEDLSVRLHWDRGGPGQTRFEIERETDDSGDWQPLASVPGDSLVYSDASVDFGGTYSYRVRACNDTLCSDYSQVVEVAVPHPAVALNPDECLRAYYPFNGNADDLSGYGHDGTVVGASPCPDRAGRPDRAYHFNGVDNKITTTGLRYASHDSITVSCWVESPGQQDQYFIMCSDFGVAQWDAQLGMAISLPGTNSAVAPFPANQWHHFIGTFDGVTIRTYIDGLPGGSTNWPGHIYDVNRHLVFGSFLGYFSGSVDEIRIYCRSFSALEARQLYEFEHRAPASFALAAVSANDSSNVHLHTTRPSLTWHPAPAPDPADTVRYTVAWDTGPDFAQADTAAVGPDTTYAFPPGVLSVGQTYYWKVKSAVPGFSRWSDPPTGHSFHIIDDETPVLLVPSAEAREDGILISWKVADGTGLTAFKVYRRAGTGAWVCVAPQVVPAAAPSSTCSFLDTGADPGVRYEYEVEGLGPGGSAGRFGPVSAFLLAPARLDLRVMPNPGRGVMNAILALPRGGDVRLRVFDTQGREVARREFPGLRAGMRREQWDARDDLGRSLPNGSYYVRLETTAGEKTARWLILH